MACASSTDLDDDLAWPGIRLVELYELRLGLPIGKPEGANTYSFVLSN
jgi:hypothetical protein